MGDVFEEIQWKTYITHHLDLRQPNTSCKHVSYVRVKSEKLQYKHWHSSISIMKLKLGFEHLEDHGPLIWWIYVVKPLSTGSSVGMNAFTPVQLGTPLGGSFGHRKGTWASENHLTDLAFALAVVLLEHSKNNSWSKFMGGRKVAVSLHPMKPRHFRGFFESWMPYEAPSQRDIPVNFAGSWNHRCKRVPNETLVFGDAKGKT